MKNKNTINIAPVIPYRISLILTVWLVSTFFLHCNKDEATPDAIDAYVGDYTFVSATGESENSNTKTLVDGIASAVIAISRGPGYDISLTKQSATSVDLKFKSTDVDLSQDKLTFNPDDLAFAVTDDNALAGILAQVNATSPTIDLTNFFTIATITGELSTSNDTRTMTLTMQLVPTAAGVVATFEAGEVVVVCNLNQ